MEINKNLCNPVICEINHEVNLRLKYSMESTHSHEVLFKQTVHKLFLVKKL